MFLPAQFFAAEAALPPAVIEKNRVEADADFGGLKKLVNFAARMVQRVRMLTNC